MKKTYIIVCDNPEMSEPLYYSGRHGEQICRTGEIRKAVTFESKGGAENVLRFIETAKRGEYGADTTAWRIEELPQKEREEPAPPPPPSPPKLTAEEASKLRWAATGDRLRELVLFRAEKDGHFEYAFRDETDGKIHLLGADCAAAMTAFCKKGANRLAIRLGGRGDGV